jgi:predicted HAD superfamily Cof-like phosphohydrolase
MTFFKKVVEWNRERGLLDNEFNHERENSFIIEELLESTGNYDSLSARGKAEDLAKQITHNSTQEPEKIIDALGDIIVFATGAIAKNGYDPEKVMDEVYKEINSRTGKLINGKFVKDAGADRYYANFSDCKL